MVIINLDYRLHTRPTIDVKAVKLTQIINFGLQGFMCSSEQETLTTQIPVATRSQTKLNIESKNVFTF
ncbi:hypothetical protein BCR33DRAFT_718362 [Rhizoclosmatium globosum]|uniref:Uncharacterized protein n=1 Tax=Rhizoclosmatium globosum TaxID=329046 RepID=A0A1Y2C536_9FUNG|nr:hypothetical protein BCR33DRAFT_718362 [Rhizoclosmatium globosum]|eukprot:ORY42160.1 hypothetical protein BCR33DRAFT_718362 [Rhizoclosmatium globosum]